MHPQPSSATAVEAARRTYSGLLGGTFLSAMFSGWLFTAAFMLLTPTFALGQERTWEWRWGMHPMMFMWGVGGLVMMLMMLVFWGFVIAGIVLGARWLAGQVRGAGRDEALEILRQRYARGEIDKEEFETRKRNLGL